MGARLWLGCVVAGCLAACGGSTTSGGGAGPGGSSGTGGTAGAGGSGGSSGSGGAAGGGGVCGGVHGATCEATSFCDYTPDNCGRLDQQGTCRPRPGNCDLIYDPVCGCDGQVHGNKCAAQHAGVDLSEGGGCAPPQNNIPCGYRFCDGTTSYCQVVVDDTGLPNTYTCKPLPDPCKKTLDCSCFPATVPCSDMCSNVFGSGLDGFVLTCPGG